jgi:hypothetical protein
MLTFETRGQIPFVQIRFCSAQGVSLDEIHGVSKILDLDKLGKEWHYGIGQGNCSGNGSGGKP